jgi:hypothetical protein
MATSDSRATSLGGKSELDHLSRLLFLSVVLCELPNPGSAQPTSRQVWCNHSLPEKAPMVYDSASWAHPEFQLPFLERCFRTTMRFPTQGIFSILPRFPLSLPQSNQSNTQSKNPLQAFLTGDAISLFLDAARALLRARLDFCAMRASLFNCSSALITSASSVETFLPSITRKPGVAGMLRAAAAAAERRVTRGVARGVLWEGVLERV